MTPRARLVHDLRFCVAFLPLGLLLSVVLGRDAGDAVQFGLVYTALWVVAALLRFTWALRTRNDD